MLNCPCAQQHNSETGPYNVECTPNIGCRNKSSIVRREVALRLKKIHDSFGRKFVAFSKDTMLLSGARTTAWCRKQDAIGRLKTSLRELRIFEEASYITTSFEGRA